MCHPIVINIKNGKYKLASDYPGLDIKFPKVYKRISGDKLVENGIFFLLIFLIQLLQLGFIQL